jgi:hypothetical protein
MSGKGSRPRPISVDQQTFNDNWDRIFGRVKATWICARCGRDRLKEACELQSDLATMFRECPMQGTAYDKP